MPKDTAIAEVRSVRHEISAQFGHDVTAYCRHLRSMSDSLEKEGVKLVYMDRDSSGVSSTRVQETHKQ